MAKRKRSTDYADDPLTRAQQQAEVEELWKGLTRWQRAAMSYLLRLYVANERCPTPEGAAERKRWEKVLRSSARTGCEYPVPRMH
jgi:hypothetical protein